jgi:glycosyltransferase involved in cell wall biosynthesis
MKTLDVFGSYTGPTGYDNLVRLAVAQLASRGVDVALQNFEKWSNFRVVYNEMFDQLAKKRKIGSSRALLNFCLPPQAIYNEHQFNMVYTMFEGTVVNELWAETASSMDLVIVPTESSMEAFRARGVRDSILKKVHIGIDTKQYHEDVKARSIFDGELVGLERFKYRVFNIQELGPRKNIEGLIRAWIIGTKGEMKDQACLVLKMSAYSPNRYGQFVAMLNDIRYELGISLHQHAPIFVSCRLFADSDIPSYMASMTHYISMSKAEGWDLPAMQAAALGKSLIVPFHSSYTEWINKALVNPVMDFKKERSSSSDPSLAEVYQDAEWFVPSVESFADRIANLKVSDGASAFAKEIADNFSIDRIGDQWMSVLEEEVYSHKPGIPRRNLVESYHSVDRKDGEGPIKEVICHWTKNIGKACGIANYTSSLSDAMLKQSSDVGFVGGDIRAHDMLLSMNKYAVENIQLEYQFAHPIRLAYMLQCCRERGVKSIVTMHTFSEEASAHNAVVFKYADKIIVHSELVKKAMQDAFYPVEKVVVMPMPVPKLMTSEERSSLSRIHLPSNRFLIGYYGFLYFHKGVEKLVNAFARVKEKIPSAMLILHASKPQNTADDVSGRVLKAFEKHGLAASRDYLWISKYEDNERAALSVLSQCHLNVLPYDHYGSYGTSAAIGSVLAAGVPTLVSDVCWFSHVPPSVASRYITPNVIGGDEVVRLADSIIDIHGMLKDEVFKKQWVENIKNYVEEHQYANVASAHFDLCKSLTGIEFRGQNGNT